MVTAVRLSRDEETPGSARSWKAAPMVMRPTTGVAQADYVWDMSVWYRLVWQLLDVFTCTVDFS